MTTTVPESLARAVMGDSWTDARLEGFGWECHKSAGKVTCAARGTDRGEYVAHMRGHGAKVPALSVPALFRLPKVRKAPRATFEPVEVPVFKWLTWTQHHMDPVTCTACEHPEKAHHCWHGNDGETYACERCSCRAEVGDFPVPVRYEAERRGQFLSEGPYPHSVWVIPTEPAPWESGHAAPVTLFVIEAGRYTTDYQEMRSERRAANRRARDAKQARKAAA